MYLYLLSDDSYWHLFKPTSVLASKCRKKTQSIMEFHSGHAACTMPHIVTSSHFQLKNPQVNAQTYLKMRFGVKHWAFPTPFC